MQQSILPKQEELSTTLNTTSEQNTDNSSSHTLIKREQIPGTPFTLIWTEKDGWFTTMGDHRLTEPTKTKNEQYLKLEKDKWLIITNVIIIILDKMNQQAKDFEALNMEQSPYETESL